MEPEVHRHVDPEIEAIMARVQGLLNDVRGLTDDIDTTVLALRTFTTSYPECRKKSSTTRRQD